MWRISMVVGVLLACSISLAAQIPVSMIDNAFVPDSLVINPGDSVVWTNNGVNPHTSTSGTNGVPDGQWSSGTLSHGASFVHGFSASGKFRYYCQFHYALGMKGVIDVRPTGAGELSIGADRAPAVVCSPNPFRSAVTLRFASAQARARRISVFDTGGRLVRELVETPNGLAVWDGRNGRGEAAGPGVYICRCGASALAVTLER